ncbi:hypothetical protein GEMRC1_013010 [Eukaryota sp. GEM-RC1]
MFIEVDSDFNIIWLTALVTSVVILILFVVSFLNRKSLRVGGFLVYVFAVLFIVNITTAVYFSISAESVFTDDTSPLVLQSRAIFASVVDLEWQFNFVRRRIDLLTFDDVFVHFALAQNAYQILLQHIVSLRSGELVSHPAFDDVIDSISHQLDLMDESVSDYVDRVRIISKLATYHLPEYQLSTLVNITWDIDHLPLSERNTWNLPHGYSVSNSETDLENDVEYLKNVSRAILTSKYFYSLTRDLVESFADIRRSTTYTLIETVDEFNDQFTFELQITVYLVIALLISSVIFCFYIIFSGLKEREKAPHIKQKISFPAMVNYSKQYILSLSVLFILLSMFYLGSLIGFTQLRPLPRLIQDYGQRSALITRTTNDIVSAFIEPEQQLYYLNNAQVSYSSLLRLHHSLVVNHVDGDSEQTKLLLIVNLMIILDLSTI